MKSEKVLSEELGMDRKTLRALRMDALSADSWTKESNQIVYTAEGEHELRNVIQRKLASEALSPPLEEKEPKTADARDVHVARNEEADFFNLLQIAGKKYKKNKKKNIIKKSKRKKKNNKKKSLKKQKGGCNDADFWANLHLHI